jgi:hypothetical protein
MPLKIPAISSGISKAAGFFLKIEKSRRLGSYPWEEKRRRNVLGARLSSAFSAARQLLTDLGGTKKEGAENDHRKP